MLYSHLIFNDRFYVLITLLLPAVAGRIDQQHDRARYVAENDFVFFEIVEPSDTSYTFRSRAAKNFGTNFDQPLKNVYLIPAQPLIACSRLQNDVAIAGSIALIERGDCSFVTKVISAQESGALGVLIMDNDHTVDTFFLNMIDDLTEREVRIPVMFLQYRDGHMILDSIAKNHLIGAQINIPLNLTYNDMLKTPRAPWSYWL